MSESPEEHEEAGSEPAPRKGLDGALVLGLVCAGLIALLIIANSVSC